MEIAEKWEYGVRILYLKGFNKSVSYINKKVMDEIDAWNEKKQWDEDKNVQAIFNMPKFKEQIHGTENYAESYREKKILKNKRTKWYSGNNWSMKLDAETSISI